MRNRTLQLNIRLSEDEHAKLMKSISKTNFSISGYIRALINRNSPKECPPLQYNELMNESRFILNILGGIKNEICRREFFSEDDRKELKDEIILFHEILLQIQAAFLLPEEAKL
jgi:hypothetical protein